MASFALGRTIRRFLPGALAFSMLVAAAHPAHGQTAAEKATAEALFVEAKRLMDAKRFSEACPKLADSQKLDPGVGTLLNLALCYRENGQSASSWTTYREAAALARANGQMDREALARDEAAAVEKTLTRLVIQVPKDVAQTSGLEIKRDGALVPQSLWGIPAPVDPGVRTVNVTAPGKKPVELEVKAEGAGNTAQIEIPPLVDDPAAAAPPPLPAPAPVPVSTAPGQPEPAPGTGESKPGKGQMVAGFAVGGVGAIAIGVGTWFALKSIAEGKAADKAADNALEHPSQRDYYQARKEKFENDADGSRTIAFIGLGAGVACLVGGIVLVATAPKARKEAKLEFLPELDRDHAGLVVRGTF
jgi:serine/threonine-protein kinase